MALQLHCKRSKIFIQSGSRPVKCGRDETTSVPDWVQDTLGYKAGIADKSIIDLTPVRAVVVAAVDSGEVTALKARIAELKAQVADLQAQHGIIPDEGDYGNPDSDIPEKPADSKSVVDLNQAKSTAEAAGEAAGEPAEPKPSKATPVPAAKGLQGRRR